MRGAKRAFADALRIVHEHRRAYWTLTAAYYGLTLAAMLTVVFFPAVQKTLIDAVTEGFQKGPLKPVGSAYAGGHLGAAIILTFFVNLLGGSLLTITIPSLVVPFSGLLMGVVRATLWGLLLAPTSQTLALAMIPHSLTLLLEGQAYVVALLAVWIHGRSFVAPQSTGAASCGEGYWIGLKKTARLYLLVVVLLAVAAVYEALEVLYVVPRLIGEA
ncbi:MAG: hypothetical protein N3D11_12275 [Candidatus Sumerlaeia bacterium]|nr:hypothetical protein [Candidatus Sumerlaeia bacterium]